MVCACDTEKMSDLAPYPETEDRLESKIGFHINTLFTFSILFKMQSLHAMLNRPIIVSILSIGSNLKIKTLSRYRAHMTDVTSQQGCFPS